MRQAEAAQRAEAGSGYRAGAAEEEAAELPAAQPIGPAVDQLPPVVDVISPGLAVTASEPKLTLKLRIRTPAAAPVSAITTRVVSGTAGVPGPAGQARCGRTDPVGNSAEEDAQVQIVATNRWGSSLPAVVRVRYVGKPAATQRGKGVLHLVSIGVSDYDNPRYRLGLAAKDAQDFGRLLGGQQGKLYDKVEATVLTDKTAGKAAVEKALADLRDRVQPQDTTFVFLAGHGINDDAGEYLFLPKEADLARLRDTGISFRLMRQVLASLPGRILMFVDTCHAGNALGDLRAGLSRDNTVAINELASVENNIIVFASVHRRAGVHRRRRLGQRRLHQGAGGRPQGRSRLQETGAGDLQTARCLYSGPSGGADQGPADAGHAGTADGARFRAGGNRSLSNPPVDGRKWGRDGADRRGGGPAASAAHG